MKIHLILGLVVMLIGMAGWTNNSIATVGTYTAKQIRTAAVNSSGKRYDTESTECITAPQGQLFEQASFQTRVVHHADDDERRCTAQFRDYAEYAPDILEPRTACLYSYVKSVGGWPVNNNKRGHLQCAMDYRTHEDVYIEQSTNKNTTGGDAKSVVIGLPADLTLEREKHSLVTVSVPLRTLQFAIDQAIRDKKDMNLPAGFELRIMGSEFRSYSTGSREFHYYVDLDITGPVGARCEVDARFAIPAAHPDSVLVQDIGTTTNCRTGSTIGQWFNLAQKLSNAIRGAITQSLGKKLFDGNSTFSDWAKDDPDLAAIVQKSLIQGRYCDWRREPGLCIAIGWRQVNTINSWESMLLSRVPGSEGALDRNSAQQKLEAFVKEAIDNHQTEVNGIRYPTGRFPDGRIEDGDMGIFGGLLCRSGDEKEIGSKEGCKLIQNANTSDGRFWRSPGRKGESDTKEHASFSGDQLKGILHYFTTMDDKDRLEKFLHYLRSKPTQVPDPSVVLESGYSSCPNYGPNFTCLLSGSDWYALRLLAHKHGLESALPHDLPSMDSRYGFSYETLIWEALLTNSGYRLHLVANTAWILRNMGENDAHLDKVFQIIAARQPENPFFLYLLLGTDRRVQRLTDAKCMLPLNRNDFSDWAWQRAETQHAWDRSMVWDCVFMYGLMAREPISKKP